MTQRDPAPHPAKRGAGVIPFSVNNGRVSFLFQTAFSGRKTGFLIDFGGGVGPQEDFREAAIREFVEETETMYFSDDIAGASRSNGSVEKQVPLVASLFEQTLQTNPDWWCRRLSEDPLRPKQWKTFFIEFPYRDLGVMNRAWASDTSGRFKKRRELFWVGADELLTVYQRHPERLWKRVRQLENAPQLIARIQRSKRP